MKTKVGATVLRLLSLSRSSFHGRSSRAGGGGGRGGGAARWEGRPSGTRPRCRTISRPADGCVPRAGSEPGSGS